MEFSEKLKKAKADIAKLFQKFEETAPVEGEMKEGTLKDGTVIKYDKLEEGGKVVLVTEQGEVNAPEGEHELNDGSVITVNAEGLITAVKPKEEEAPEEVSTPEQMREAAQKFATGTPEDRIANLEVIGKALMEYCFGWELRESTVKAIKDQAIAAYKESFAEKFESKLEQFSNQFKESAEMQKLIVELMDEMSKEEGAAPVQRPNGFIQKSEAKKTAKESFTEALKKLNTEDK